MQKLRDDPGADRLRREPCRRRVFAQNLRGHWQDIFSLGPYFRSLGPGRFRVIILDAMYRFMPRKVDENDNGVARPSRRECLKKGAPSRNGEVM